MNRTQVIIPVSYTHLDVYKRQARENRLHRLHAEPGRARGDLLGGGSVCESDTGGQPVSYTHLDVYKRQGLDRGGRLFTSKC